MRLDRLPQSGHAAPAAVLRAPMLIVSSFASTDSTATSAMDGTSSSSSRSNVSSMTPHCRPHQDRHWSFTGKLPKADPSVGRHSACALHGKRARTISGEHPQHSRSLTAAPSADQSLLLHVNEASCDTAAYVHLVCHYGERPHNCTTRACAAEWRSSGISDLASPSAPDARIRWSAPATISRPHTAMTPRHGPSWPPY